MEARRDRWRIGGSILIAVAVLGVARGAHAYSIGVTSDQFPDSALGCNSAGCHSGGTMPTVSLTGPTSVPPGSTNVYTLTINNPLTQPKGGLNVSAPDGIFSVGGPVSAHTQTLSNGMTGALEITHIIPESAVSGVTTFTFQWTAPSSFASVTLTGWGNAVNGDHKNTGDAASSSILVVSNSSAQVPRTSTSSPTATPTPAPPTATATPSRTATHTPTRTRTATVTKTASAAPMPTATPRLTPTQSPVPPPTVVPSPTRSPVCLGDCNNDGKITAAELTRIVALILQCGGAAQGCPAVPSGCLNADGNGDGSISAGELTSIIWNILDFPSGCPIARSALPEKHGL